MNFIKICLLLEFLTQILSYTDTNCFKRNSKLIKISHLKSKFEGDLKDFDQAAKGDVQFQVKLSDKLISTLFSFKPLFKFASSKARSKMVEQGLKISVDWKSNIKYLDNNFDNLISNYESLKKKSIIYPEYYEKPFHAYDEGNLCWQAAMEVESAALTVHAPIFTSNKNELDINGDFLLRDNFHKNVIDIFKESNFSPKRILDIGCSTGLSTIKLHSSFPKAEIIGIDLSPYMLSVAKFNLETRSELVSAKKSIKYIHSMGEDTSFGPNDFDHVSMSLVSHELPAHAAKAIFKEAYRILPSGGVFSFMDIDPESLFFQKFASNPIAFTAFKSTEPWIQEYVSMDLVTTLKDCGYKSIQIRANSPRHRTVVAFK